MHNRRASNGGSGNVAGRPVGFTQGNPAKMIRVKLVAIDREGRQRFQIIPPEGNMLGHMIPGHELGKEQGMLEVSTRSVLLTKFGLLPVEIELLVNAAKGA
jgi:hypothetical protein